MRLERENLVSPSRESSTKRQEQPLRLVMVKWVDIGSTAGVFGLSLAEKCLGPMRELERSLHARTRIVAPCDQSVVRENRDVTLDL
jgi:hypothetical protein